ncbi:MAG: hypothetical protein WD638_07290 [Nitriliruptoraceae bacterium]
MAISRELAALGMPWQGVGGAVDPGSLSRDEWVLVAATGGGVPETRDHLRRAVEAGVDVIDVDRDPGHLHWLHAELGSRAAGRGARIVAGAGLRWALGDVLAAEAGVTVDGADAVHVAYTSGRRTATARRGTPGERRAWLAGLGRPATALVDGRWVDELPGEARRLAWFPRPVGPSHAAAVPGGECVTVPRHLPGVQTVRTYEAVTAWRAELLQATANLARTEWGRRWLAGRVSTASRSPSAAALAATRWGCVAEVAGTATVGRAWAYGHDPVRLTAAIAVVLARCLGAIPDRVLPGGALAPAEVIPPRAMLDELAERTDLRWSRTTVELPAEARGR